MNQYEWVVIAPGGGDQGGVANATLAHCAGLKACGEAVTLWTASEGLAQKAADLGVDACADLTVSYSLGPVAKGAFWRRLRHVSRNANIIHQGGRSWFWGRAMFPSGLHGVVYHNRKVGVRALYRNALTVSSAQAERVRAQKVLGLRPYRAVAVKNGFLVSSTPDPATSGPNRPPRVAALANLIHKKGLDLLIDAAARLRDRGVEIEVHIGGEGSLRAQLEAQIAKLGLESQVKLRGWVDAESFLTQADIFCLPSRDEPFGIVVIEAMALGAPVIAAAADGPRDILTHGVTGWLTPLNDAPALAECVAARLKNPAATREVAARGRAHACSAYSPQAVGETLIRAFQAFRARQGDFAQTARRDPASPS